MATTLYNDSMSLEEYLRNFHGTGGERIWGGQPATEAEPWNQQYVSNIVGYTPGTDINQWIAANGGDINRILADGRGVYSGRFGDASTNLDQWVPKYDPATGMVTYQVSGGGDEYGGLAMAGALGFLGAAVPGFGGLGDLFGGTGSSSGSALGAAEEAAMLGGGLGSSAPIAPVSGGLESILTGNYSPTDPLGLGGGNTGQTFIGDQTLGGSMSTIPDATALSPTGSIGTGGLEGALTGTGNAVQPWNLHNPLSARQDAFGPTGNAGGGPATPTGTGGAGTGTTGAGSLLSRLFGGNPTTSDWMSLLGTLGSTGLGLYGANQQGDALRDIANQARSDRMPFLNQATQWFNDPSSYYSGAPAQAAMNATLRGLSTQGNPLGSGTSLALANEAGLRNWQNAWTGAANIGLGGQDSRNSLLAQAAGADSGGLNALGYGLNQLTQPRQQSLTDLMRSLNPNLNFGTGLS